MSLRWSFLTLISMIVTATQRMSFLKVTHKRIQKDKNKASGLKSPAYEENKQEDYIEAISPKISGCSEMVTQPEFKIYPTESKIARLVWLILDFRRNPDQYFNKPSEQ